MGHVRPYKTRARSPDPLSPLSNNARQIRQTPIQPLQQARDHVWSPQGLPSCGNALRPLPQGFPCGRSTRRNCFVLAMKINGSGALAVLGPFSRHPHRSQVSGLLQTRRNAHWLMAGALPSANFFFTEPRSEDEGFSVSAGCIAPAAVLIVVIDILRHQRHCIF